MIKQQRTQNNKVFPLHCMLFAAQLNAFAFVFVFMCVCVCVFVCVCAKWCTRVSYILISSAAFLSGS